MRILVAGRDRTGDIGRDISERSAAARSHPRRPPSILPIHSALYLGAAADTSEYLDRMLALMVLKLGINTSDVYIAGSPTLCGRLAGRLRNRLWKMLRYQHERITSQQNTINGLLAIALGLLREEYREQKSS